MPIPVQLPGATRRNTVTNFGIPIIPIYLLSRLSEVDFEQSVKTWRLHSFA